RTLTVSHARLQAARIPMQPGAPCSTPWPAVGTRSRRERGESIEIGTLVNVIVFTDRARPEAASAPNSIHPAREAGERILPPDGFEPRQPRPRPGQVR